MHLFTPFRLGSLELPHRIVMAPMTRSRAPGGLPNELMADYYSARASAGLIVTEGIAPSPNGLGYARIPGLFSDEQVAGFRSVTGRVHAAGGRIFAQLMHTGRIGHSLNLPQDARVLAPSAVASTGTMWTDRAGSQPLPVPAAMSRSEVVAAVGEFVRAAENAIAAGFDGIELHGANGYLLEQFLNPHTNRRDDDYGGDAMRRTRFVIEVARETARAIGSERVGLRLSPYNTYNDLPLYDEIEVEYVRVAESVRGLAYLHLVRNADPRFVATRARMRRAFGGPFVDNGGYDAASAEAALASGETELVSFGRPFIANPDFVARVRNELPLSAPDPSTFYTPGAKGYVDYPLANPETP